MKVMSSFFPFIEMCYIKTTRSKVRIPFEEAKIEQVCST